MQIRIASALTDVVQSKFSVKAQHIGMNLLIQFDRWLSLAIDPLPTPSPGLVHPPPWVDAIRDPQLAETASFACSDDPSNPRIGGGNASYFQSAVV